jgi:PRTRC genetic system protein C
MTIENMPRIFRYSGLTLPDIDGLDVESVRSLYAATYPEITTAALTGPEAVDGKLIYTFTKAIGTKGSRFPQSQPLAKMIMAVFRRPPWVAV